MAGIRKSTPDSAVLKLPNLEEAAYLIGLLLEAGLASTSGMGAVPLSWQDIDAWIRVTESSPSVWQKLLVRELSEAYVAELNLASDVNRPDPYIHVDEVEKDEVAVDRLAVNNKLKGAFASLKKKPSV